MPIIAVTLDSEIVIYQSLQGCRIANVTRDIVKMMGNCHKIEHLTPLMQGYLLSTKSYFANLRVAYRELMPLNLLLVIV